MTAAEFAAYVLGAALVSGGGGLALGELLRRRRERHRPLASGRRFDPDAETNPDPRRFDPERTAIESRDSIADAVAAEGRKILADAERLRQTGRHETETPPRKGPPPS